jgi:ankyrin repeat protein
VEGTRDVVSALIAVGADVNATHDHGFTVLMSAVSSSNRCSDIIDALVDAVADPLAVSDFGWNAFHARLT